MTHARTPAGEKLRTQSHGIDRRQAAAGLGGILVAFAWGPRLSLAAEAGGKRAEAKLPGTLGENPRLDSWLRIGADGTVTVSPGRVELGQGAITALAQIAADELDVDVARLVMQPVDTAHSPNEGFTAGSNSMQAGGGALRAAAAEARHILLEDAARRLNAAADTLRVADGTVSAPGGTHVTYWEIAAEISLARDATGTVAPKPAAALRVVGKPVPRLDIPAKIMGGAAYVQDMRPEGAVHGRVVRPPSYDSELAALDEAKVRHMPGVLALVRDGRFLGVVAEREEQAIAARTALIAAAQWRVPETLPDQADVHAYLRERPGTAAETVNEKAGTRVVAAKTIGATYTKPYISHGSIGPSAALAHFSGGVMNVWSHTQGPYPLRTDLAKVLELPPENLRVIHAQGSGCYGHNGADDAALDAALLARAVPGRPVKLQWMREDEFGWEPFGSAMSMRAQAALDADGMVTDWTYDVWSNTHNMRPGPRDGVNLLAAWHLAKPFSPGRPRELALPGGGGDRNAVPTYEFANQKIVDHLVTDMPLRVSALRTLGGFGNVFAVESFMDEMALAAGADPVTFRLKHLTDPRARAVLAAAADKAAWTQGAKPRETNGVLRGRGVAFCRYETTKTYVALIADVSVTPADGAVRVEKVTLAADAGRIVNPDGLANQLEGGVVQGASWTLKEQVKFDRSRILTRDWADYPILTFSEVPDIEVTLIDHPELPSLGAGEASQGPIAAAIANAIHHAAGVRLRDLPFTPERVKTALA